MPRRNLSEVRHAKIPPVLSRKLTNSALAAVVAPAAPRPDTHSFRVARLAAHSRTGRAQAEMLAALSAACSMISKSAGFTQPPGRLRAALRLLQLRVAAPDAGRTGSGLGGRRHRSAVGRQRSRWRLLKSRSSASSRLASFLWARASWPSGHDRPRISDPARIGQWFSLPASPGGWKNRGPLHRSSKSLRFSAVLGLWIAEELRPHQAPLARPRRNSATRAVKQGGARCGYARVCELAPASLLSRTADH